MANTCRLCGEEKVNPLSIELSDKTTSSNWNYRELIEHHTRVSLRANKLLPQSVCESCTTIVENFYEFAQHIQAVQDTFSIEDEQETVVTECFELQLIPLMIEDVVKEQKESARSSSSNSESESEKDEPLENNDKAKVEMSNL
jgi:Zinc-finger associated domain (zf-AD)